MNNEVSVWEEIEIRSTRDVPKYMQVSKAVVDVLEQGKVDTEGFLPSINELSFSLDVSRDTVEKAYGYLKRTGVIESVPGKGYLVRKETSFFSIH